jgi:transglutaminase-like putative cysteine protease
MRYRLHHLTRYQYDHEVSVSHHVVRVQPRDLPGQICHLHELQVDPAPATRTAHRDAFGNLVVCITLEGPHRQLEFRARSEVDRISRPGPEPDRALAWDTVRDQCAAGLPGTREAGPFLFPSTHVPFSSACAAYAAPDFTPGRPWLDATLDFLGRLHRELVFDPRATHVATRVENVLRERRGVCQDFAHLSLACLRSLGLPARYVSGYLETRPPPGQSRLAGADASHAWISAFVPGSGWIDLDPTNNLRPSQQHITVAWGRDYDDVSPVRGVLLGAGSHQLHVAVDVEPLDQARELSRPML